MGNCVRRYAHLQKYALFGENNAYWAINLRLIFFYFILRHCSLTVECMCVMLRDELACRAAI